MDCYYPHSDKKPILDLLSWHGGQASFIYSVGSCWLSNNSVPDENVIAARNELDKYRNLEDKQDQKAELSNLIKILDHIHTFNCLVRNRVRYWLENNGYRGCEGNDKLNELMSDGLVYLTYQSVGETGRSITDGDLEHILTEKELESLEAFLKQGECSKFTDCCSGGILDQIFHYWEDMDDD